MTDTRIFTYRWIYFFIAAALLLALGCGAPPAEETALQKEMLVYCGITMIKPMLEISAEIEAAENVKIIITKGGSGNLMKSFLYSKEGDLYLPGSERYHQILEKEHPGVILEKVFVGHNKAAIMVQKGNPKKISPDLKNFIRPEYAVVIGNPNSGSIGKETRVILEKEGIYDQVLRNTMKLTTDSKDLVKVLVSKEADLVINWYAVSTWEENRDAMDVMEIDPALAKKKRLVLGLLKYSRNKEVAGKFMAYASSDKGRAVFKKYGLYFE